MKLGNKLGERIDNAKRSTQEKLHEEAQNPTTQKVLKFRQLPHGLWMVYWEGGGEIPPELAGFFTTIHQIKKSIAAYEVRKERVCLVQ